MENPKNFQINHPLQTPDHITSLNRKKKIIQLHSLCTCGSSTKITWKWPNHQNLSQSISKMLLFWKAPGGVWSHFEGRTKWHREATSKIHAWWNQAVRIIPHPPSVCCYKLQAFALSRFCWVALPQLSTTATPHVTLTDFYFHVVKTLIQLKAWMQIMAGDKQIKAGTQIQAR